MPPKNPPGKPNKPPQGNTQLEEEVLAHLRYIVGQLGEQRFYLQKILKNQGHPQVDQAKIDLIFAAVERNKALLASAGIDPVE